MSNSFRPTNPTTPRPTRRGHHLAPSARSGRRQTRRKARYAPHSWGLSLTGMWLLCSACSFNNSFQDGCIGSIRIQVPPDHNQAKKIQAKKSPSPKRKVLVAQASPPDQFDEMPPMNLEMHTTQAIAHTTTAKKQGLVEHILATDNAALALGSAPKKEAPLNKASTKTPSVAPASTNKLIKDLKLDLWMMPPLERQQATQPTKKRTVVAEKCPPAKVSVAKETPTTSGLFALRKNTISGSVSYSLRLLRRLLRAEAQMPRTKSWSGRARTQVLQSDVPEAIWQERPPQIQICFDREHTNKGWNQAHPAQNTASLTKRCQSAMPLGKGKRWFVLSDTFAASATSCRLFFSPGRLAVIAQCGETLYRAPIRSFASCLQQQKNCHFPHMTLQRLPQQSQQTVEIQVIPPERSKP